MAMEGEMFFDRLNFPDLLSNDRLTSSEVIDSLWISHPSSSFHGSASMVNFEASHGEHNNLTTPFFTSVDSGENGNEDYDKSFYPRDKKRRLTVDQVEFLENSFEVENKLEPDRKIQLAKEVNLQPRQVAIWFQNRRARYKTKQLEKDYNILKSSYDKLNVDLGSLREENDKLKQEVHLLMEKLVHREIGSKEVEPINSTDMEPFKPIPIVNSINATNGEPNVVCKVEDVNSAKSYVFDSEADSSHVFQGEHSDLSQDDEHDNLSQSLLQPPCFPKLERGSYIDANESCCNMGYPVEDQSFWNYGLIE